jgi:hypothetical protein
MAIIMLVWAHDLIITQAISISLSAPAHGALFEPPMHLLVPWRLSLISAMPRQFLRKSAKPQPSGYDNLTYCVSLPRNAKAFIAG